MLTLEDAAAIDPDEYPGDVVDGVWVPVTKNTWRHGEVMVTVGALLKAYAKAHPGWAVAAGDPGAKLRETPALLRGPDVAILRAERAPRGRGVHGWIDGAPDVAVEIMGDDSTVAELARKALEYLAAGAKQVWVLDCDAESVLVYTPPDHVKVLGRDERLEGGEALPGFGCVVAELFE